MELSKSFDSDIKKQVANNPKAQYKLKVNILLAKIGFRIANYRQKHHLTQRQLSKLSGVTQSSINRIENGGNASTATLVKLSMAMHCKMKLPLTLPA